MATASHLPLKVRLLGGEHCNFIGINKFQGHFRSLLGNAQLDLALDAATQGRANLVTSAKTFTHGCCRWW